MQDLTADGAPRIAGLGDRQTSGVAMELGMAASKQPRKQVERREEAETKILHAAIRLIVDKGYDRFSLAEVGEAAGYSRGLPAHYFGKKEDLLSEVVRYIVDNYRLDTSKTDNVEAGLPTLIARIRAYGQVSGSRGSRALGTLIAEAMFRPKLKRTVSALNLQGAKRLEAEIQAGIAAGNVRPDVNVKAQAAVIYAFLRGQMAFAALDPKFDVAGTTEEFVQTLTERLAAPDLGLKAAKGRRRGAQIRPAARSE
jgi:TetR/AcrR family acrAB operon transcriptional repressor